VVISYTTTLGVAKRLFNFSSTLWSDGDRVLMACRSYGDPFSPIGNISYSPVSHCHLIIGVLLMDYLILRGDVAGLAATSQA
jgi:hypothetical protein